MANKEDSIDRITNFLCYNATITNDNEIWKTDDVIRKHLPLLGSQIFVTVMISRVFGFFLKPLHQPRLVAEVFAGLPLCGQVLKKLCPPLFLELYNPRGVLGVEVLCNLGAIFYSFLSGLEINLHNLLRVRRKAATIAISGMIIPLIMGISLYSLHRKTFKASPPFDINSVEKDLPKAYLLWSLALTVTGFPVLAQILAGLKLLYTELGRSALNTAIISDSLSWLMFMIFIPFALNDGNGIYTVLCASAFVILCIYLVRPVLKDIINRKTDSEDWSDQQLLYVLMGTLLFAYITDILGSNGIFGAFVFGLILPHGRFTEVMTSSLNDFVCGVLTPLFFAGSGMRMDLGLVFNKDNWLWTSLLVFLLCTPKIVSTLMATYFYGIPVRDGLGLGLLMNTKGVMAVIMLNIAWDRSILKASSYTIISLSIIVMTILSSIIINLAYKPRRLYHRNKHRTIQSLGIEAELRILACVHNIHQASSLVSVIECFNSNRISPLRVLALYLIELTNCNFLFLDHMDPIVSSLGSSSQQNKTQTQAELDDIVGIFKGLAHDGVEVETVSVMSKYNTIHKDISNSANERRTSLILLPFHKELYSEGILNNAYREININAMHDSPCSVGILVDEGIGTLCSTTNNNEYLNVLVLFIGGPDDREALAVAWRLAAHPRILVTLVRMRMIGDAAETDEKHENEELDKKGVLTSVIDDEKQKEMDEEYVDSFRMKAMNNEDSITYLEREIHKGEDIPVTLNELIQKGYDLYIVGQGRGRNLGVFTELLQWCDFPELGVIGDLLVSDNFGSPSSVLVIQQYGYGGIVLENNKTTTHQQSPFPTAQNHDISS